MDRSKLKSAAKRQIKGRLGILFLINVIIGLISVGATYILSLIPLVGTFAAAFVTAAFLLSTSRVYLNLTTFQEPDVSDAFSGFDDILQAFLVQLLVGIFIFLWSLLFIIPGIIKSYSYSMSMYVLADYKGKSAIECINESKYLTDGHKMDLFILDLSFLGWDILSVFTLFILNIWLTPYKLATRANAYRSLNPLTVTKENTHLEASVNSETIETAEAPNN